MKARVQKWGNSLAVRIPKPFAAGLAFSEGTAVDLTLEDGALVIRPGREGTYDLEALLSGVTEENLHAEWETEVPGAVPDGNGEP